MRGDIERQNRQFVGEVVNFDPEEIFELNLAVNFYANSAGREVIQWFDDVVFKLAKFFVSDN